MAAPFAATHMTTIESGREAFCAGTRTSLSRFVVDDCVCVVGGDGAGITGAVVSIEGLEPDCHYLIEDGLTGKEHLVAASDLRLVE